MNDQAVTIPLKRFLLINQCPATWKSLDLYLFRDETVVFYVGQSYFSRSAGVGTPDQRLQGPLHRGAFYLVQLAEIDEIHHRTARLAIQPIRNGGE